MLRCIKANLDVVDVQRGGNTAIWKSSFEPHKSVVEFLFRFRISLLKRLLSIVRFTATSFALGWKDDANPFYGPIDPRSFSGYYELDTGWRVSQSRSQDLGFRL